MGARAQYLTPLMTPRTLLVESLPFGVYIINVAGREVVLASSQELCCPTNDKYQVLTPYNKSSELIHSNSFVFNYLFLQELHTTTQTDTKGLTH